MIGVILAGGRSSRFGGTPKGLQVLRGMPMVGHVHASLSLVCRDVLIECQPGAGYEGWGVGCIAAHSDHAGKGPLAGILAGLENAGANEPVAFVPCDMPLVPPVVFERLAREPPGAHAVSPGGPEPLVCVLSRDMASGIAAVLSGDSIPSVSDVFADLGVVPVPFAETWPFENINTPADLVRLEARFRGGPGLL